MMNEKLERIWVEPGMPGYTDEPNELYTTEYVLRDRFEALEAENEKLRKALDIYQRERDRFKHAYPEITGAYFLTGGHGERDDNMLPEFVRIVPAYGCAWEQVYVKTDKTISYEGS
ncbi:hypothetical protein N9B98_03350 [bacterium]|nr:hypothetical protein [bacterium]